MNDWTVIFATLLIVTVVSGLVFAPYKEVLNECEKNLPRNKHCVLTAIPEDSKGETK